MRFSRAIFFSVLLHAVLALGLVALVIDPVLVSSSVNPPIVLEISESDLSKERPPAVRRDRSRPAKTRERMARFFPSQEEQWRDLLHEEAGVEKAFQPNVEVARVWTDSWSYSWDPGFHSRFGDDPQLRSFRKAILDRIEDQVVDHPLLSEYGHHGLVFLRFAVRPDGTVIGSSLAAQSTNVIVKVRSARAIRRGLEKPLSAELRLNQTEDLWMSARFHWTADCDRRPTFAGPFLAFCRRVAAKPEPTTPTSRITSRAAVVLSPSAFADWGNAFKQLKSREWREDTNFDPFEPDRRDPDANL